VPSAIISLPTRLRNELCVFLAIYGNPSITSKRAIATSGLQRSTFFSALSRLRVKGVITNISRKGLDANYQFNEEAINRFKAELSIHSQPSKPYNRFEPSLITAIRQEHEKEIRNGFIKINPERLANEVEKRTNSTKRQLVTKTCELEANEIPLDVNFRDILARYNQLNPGESELSYWNRKLAETQQYSCLGRIFFTEYEIKLILRSIKTEFFPLIIQEK
jgi:hypothetical protein